MSGILNQDPTLGEALQILELEILLDVRDNTAPPPGPREK